MTTTSHTVNINVTDNGTIAKVDSGVNKLHKDVKDLQRTASQTQAVQSSTAAKKPSSAMDYANDGKDYGVARASVGTGAASRDFAKQAQGLGGLVHVYATFAANLFAVSAAFTALSKAADTTNMVKGLDQLGAASGQALGSMAKNLTKITDGAISLRDAMTATAQATAGGLSGEQLTRLTVVAKNASQALGRDMPDALSRLTRGIVKIEPELLDELGIMTRVEKAQQDYARSLGKTATALTDFEKRQAFAVAAIAEGEKKFGAIQIDANPYSKLLASMTNLATTGLELMNKVLGPIVKLLAESPVALTAAMAGITTMLLSRAIPALTQWRVGLQEAVEQDMLAAKNKINIAEDAKNKVIAAARQEASVILAGKKAEVAAARKAAVELADARVSAIDTAEAKLKALQQSSNMGKSSKSYQILEKSIDNIHSVTEKDFAHLEKQAQRFDKTNTAVAAAYRETATALRESQAAELAGNAQKIESKKVLAAAEAQYRLEVEKTTAAIQAKNSGFLATNLGSQAKLHRDLASAQSKAAASMISNNIAMIASTEGLAAATKAAYLQIKAAMMGANIHSDVGPVQPQKLKLGDAALTGIKSGAIVAAAGIANVVSALGTLSMYAAAAGLIFAGLDKVFSTNGKQLDAFSVSIDRVDDSTKALADTLKTIDKKDVLESMSVETTKARATAIKTLADSLKGLANSLEDLINYSSGWDKFIDGFKDAVGMGAQDKLAGAIGKTVESSLKAIDDPKLKKELAERYSKLFGGLKDLSFKSIKAAAQGMSEGEVLEIFRKVEQEAKVLEERTTAAAKPHIELAESMDKASKAAQTLINSYALTDKVSVTTMSQVDSLARFTEAFKSTDDAVKAMYNSVISIQSLQGISPEIANQLLDQRAAILEVSEGYQQAKRNITIYNEELIKAKAVRSERESKLVLADASTKSKDPELIKAREAVSEIERAINILNKQFVTAEAAAMNVAKSFGETSVIALKNAYGRVTEALDRAAEQRSINMAKAINSATPGGGSQERAADLAIQELNLQKEVIKVETEMIVALRELAAKFELISSASDLEKAPKDTKEYDTAKTRYDAAAIVSTAQLAGAEGVANKILELTSKNKELTKAEYAALQQLYTYQKQTTSEISKEKDLQNKIDIESINKKKGALEDAYTIEMRRLNASFIKSQTDLDSLQGMKALNSEYNETLETAILLSKVGSENKNGEFIPGLNNEATTRANMELKKAQDIQALLAASGKQTALEKKLAISEISSLEAKVRSEEAREIEKNLASYKEYFDAKMAGAKQLLEQEEKLAKIRSEIKQIEIEDKLSEVNSYKNIDPEVKAETIAILELEKQAEDYKTNSQALRHAADYAMMDIVARHEAKMARAQTIKDPDARATAIETAAEDTRKAAEKVNAEYDLQQQKLDRANQSRIKAIDLTKTQALESISISKSLETQAELVESITGLFGELGASIGKAVDGFANMGNRQAELDKGQKESLKTLQDNHASGFDSAEEYLDKEKKIKDKYQKDSTKNELKGYGEIASGIKGLFDKKSTAYKVFDGIEKATHIARMAMTAAEIGAKVAAYFTETTAAATSVAPVVAAEGAKQGAFSITALVAALGAPWPLNIPSFLMVGAILAGLGLAFGGGGAEQVMPSGITAAERQETQGTGTVLGDSTAKSESLSKSLEIMAENSYPLLNYNEKMYKSLQSIDINIDKLAASLAQAGGITGVGPSAFGTQEGSSKSGNWLTGSKTKSTEVTDTGIRISGTLNALMDMTAAIKQYETVLTTTTKSSWFGLRNKTSTSVSENERDLGTREERQISLIFKGMADSISEGIKILGIAADPTKMMEALAADTSLFIDPTTGKSILDVSLKDLSGEDISNALNGVFSAAFDNMAAKITPWAEKFQKVGEGVGETFIRLAKDAETVKYAFESVGFADFDATFRAQADAAGTVFASATDLMEQAAALAKVTDAKAKAALAAEKDKAGIVKTMVDSETGQITYLKEQTDYSTQAIADLTAAEQEHKAIVDRLAGSTMSYSEALTTARENLIEAMGGIESFQEQMSFFQDNFLTSAEQLQINTTAATRGFAALGLELPKSRQAFADLVKGASTDLSDAGNEFFAKLMALSGVIAAMYPEIKEPKSAVETRKEELAAAEKALNETISAQESLISKLSSAANAFKSLIEGIDANILRLNKVDPSFDAVAEVTGRLTAIQAEYNTLIGSSTAENLQKQADLGKKVNDLIMEKYTAELDLLTKVNKSVKDSANAALNLRKYLDSLKVGQLSTLTNAEKLAESKKQYEAMLALAQTGDVDAKNQLSALSNAYLTMAREYYASSAEYTTIFNSVVSAIETLVGPTMSTEELLQAIKDADSLYNSASLDLARRTRDTLEELKATAVVGYDVTNSLLEAANNTLASMKASLEAILAEIKLLDNPSGADAAGTSATAYERIQQAGTSANGFTNYTGMDPESLDSYFTKLLGPVGTRTYQQVYDAIVDANADPYAVGAAYGLDITATDKLWRDNAVKTQAGIGYDTARKYYTDGDLLAIFNTPAMQQMSIAEKYAEIIKADADVYAVGRVAGLSRAALDGVLADSGVKRVPGFAEGGFFDGGLRIVGENGPELEATGRSRIWSNSELESMFSGSKNNDAMIAQLQVLTEEVKQLRTDNIKLAGMVAESNVRSNEDAALVVADAVTKSSQVRQNRSSTGNLI